jgi:hypothetical protein
MRIKPDFLSTGNSNYSLDMFQNPLSDVEGWILATVKWTLADTPNVFTTLNI